MATIVNIVQATDGTIPTKIEINSIIYTCSFAGLLGMQPNLLADGNQQQWLASINSTFSGNPASTFGVAYEVRNVTLVNVLFGVTSNTGTVLVNNGSHTPLTTVAGYIVLPAGSIATFTMASVPDNGSISVTVTEAVYCSRFWSSPQADGNSFTVGYLFHNPDTVNSYTLTAFADESWTDSSNIQLLSTTGSMFSKTGWSTAPTGVGSTPFGCKLLLPVPAVILANSNAMFTFTGTAINSGVLDLPKFLANTSTHVGITSSAVTLRLSAPLTITANICVAEGTLVSLANDAHVPVEQLRPGQWLAGHDNRPLRLAQVVRIDQPSSRFVEFERGSVANLVPTARFRIQPGHPLLIHGREVLPEVLLGLPGVREVSLEQPLHVYTLITERRDFVLMQGMSVGTWSYVGWQNFMDNDPRAVGLTWSLLQ
jgi:hypothetical protein